MSLLIIPAALVIGMVLGMFGAGGGMITVPTLIYLLDLPIKEAIAMSLWVVAIVSFGAVLQQRAWKNLQVKLLLTFGITGVFGSIAGSLGAHYVDENIQIIAFAILIFFATWWTTHIELTNQIKIFKFIPASITGFFIGILTGTLGVGGGFLLVPALIFLGIGHFPTAVAHSLILVTLNALAGGITYTNTVNFSIKTTLIISAIALLGSSIGGFMLKKFSGKQMQNAFSILLLTLGGFMIIRTLIH